MAVGVGRRGIAQREAGEGVKQRLQVAAAVGGAGGSVGRVGVRVSREQVAGKVGQLAMADAGRGYGEILVIIAGPDEKVIFAGSEAHVDCAAVGAHL